MSSHPLQRLLRYSRRYRRQVWLASVCSVLNKFFDLAPPVLIGLAVDVVVQQQDSWIAGLGIPTVRGQFLVLTALTVVTWGLESAFQYAYSVLWRNLAQTMQRDLRVEAYAHLQDLDLAYFEDHSTGGLMAVLNDDINQLERFLDVGANEVLQVLTTIILVGGAFLVLAPSVAWMAIVPMPFIVWGAIAFQNLGLLHWLYRLSPEDRAANSYLTHIATLQAYDAKRHTDLLTSLEQYLDHGGALVETAATLHIHRNTLLHRLERIEHLCNVDLKDPLQRLNLHAALKSHHLGRQ